MFIYVTMLVLIWLFQTYIQLGQLSAEQRKTVALSYLRDLGDAKEDLLPLDVFELIAGKLAVIHTVEVGMIKPTGEEGLSVLLTQRPPTDHFWPNQWHIPGSIVRPKDPIKNEHDYDAAFSRVLREVGSGIRVIGEPEEYETVRRRGARGPEVTVRLLAEVDGQPSSDGAFFDTTEALDNPPEGGLVESHWEAIRGLAEAYRRLRA